MTIKHFKFLITWRCTCQPSAWVTPSWLRSAPTGSTARGTRAPTCKSSKFWNSIWRSNSKLVRSLNHKHASKTQFSFWNYTVRLLLNYVSTTKHFLKQTLRQTYTSRELLRGHLLCRCWQPFRSGRRTFRRRPLKERVRDLESDAGKNPRTRSVWSDLSEDIAPKGLDRDRISCSSSEWRSVFRIGSLSEVRPTFPICRELSRTNTHTKWCPQTWKGLVVFLYKSNNNLIQFSFYFLNVKFRNFSMFQNLL